MYTAKVRLPKDQSSKKSKIKAEIQAKYPGMKVKFSEATLELIEVSVNANAPLKVQIASISILTPQLEDLIESFRSSN